MLDDYEGSDDDESGVDGENKAARRERKRKRFQEELEEAMEQRELEPERKKTKQEVMKEVIAKSKLHKYERQQAKEDDEDTRAQLDRELPDLLAALRGHKVKPTNKPAVNGGLHPDRLAQINASTKEGTEKEYDQRLRQMAMDKRAQPTERTKTDEEKAEEEAERLRELEAKRLRRMNGEPVSSDEESEGGEKDPRDLDGDMDFEVDEEDADEAREFGLGTLKTGVSIQPDVEDEDDFVIDPDLVASGSDVDLDSDDFSDEESADEAADDEEDADFLQDLLPKKQNEAVDKVAPSKALAYTYPCPQTHEEFLPIVNGVASLEVPTVVQRIRALYHPQLHAGNKEKLAKFAAVLVEHVAYLANHNGQMLVIESLIRHIHSLSKTHGDAVARAFRHSLQRMQETGQIGPGQLVVLTAIGSIYPTSDHFHQVVTPAITLMSRWLALTTPSSSALSLNGAYLVALAIKYQQLSRRYIPELLRFTLAALKSDTTIQDQELTSQHIHNLSSMMDLWTDKPAFTDIFAPAALALPALFKTTPKPARQAHQKLTILSNQGQLRRRPLELHHHRPLPIKTSIPKFEDNFNPGGHYEPDRERAEAAKLRKEHRREKKGALRELRRDAEFMAREQLREKKERDRAYEDRQRRIIGEIQREEGRERNEYEREKRKRKGRF
ncbi:hypothetical protein FH972_025578 [Carpinus fangiana]|uniref:Nop14-like protein n=1 Tax=Carpinus fangiana TaxID=176857 RepID=A0A5N6L1P8_9ROSI|nr:hypothetical protein FH972_025578 [Carpinus fangiana]